MSDSDLDWKYIITLIIAIFGIAFTWIYKSKERRDNLEKAKLEKLKEERILARELEKDAEVEALEVKQEMREYVQGLFQSLNKDIALAKEKSDSVEKISELKLEQFADRFKEHVESDNAIHDKTAKLIEFIQTMLWGPEAKSMPPYMLGEVETQEHKDEPPVGAFKTKEKETEAETRESEKGY